MNRIRHLRRERGWSQGELGKRVAAQRGLESPHDRQTIRKLETGEQRLTQDWMQAFAAVFEVELAALIMEPEPEPAGPRPGPLLGPGAGRDLPVYPTRPNEAGEMLMGRDPVEYLWTPHPLVGLTGGFGFYVSEASMRPAFELGDIAFVHPTKPASPDRDVLVVSRAETENGWRRAALRRLAWSSDREFALRTHSPAGESAWDRDEFEEAYLIVGRFDR